MDEHPRLVGPELDNAFTCWFNSDDIDFRDMDDVMDRADTVAMMMLNTGLTPAQIAAPLHEALRRFGPEVIQEFSDSGNIAWDYDDKYEGILRDVIGRIIAVVEQDGSNLRRLSPEEYLRMQANKGP